MQELICVNCRTPKSQWKEHNGKGYPIDNQSYCSKDCSDGATESIREHGSINQEKGKIRKYRADLVAMRTGLNARQAASCLPPAGRHSCGEHQTARILNR